MESGATRALPLVCRKQCIREGVCIFHSFRVIQKKLHYLHMKSRPDVIIPCVPVDMDHQ